MFDEWLEKKDLGEDFAIITEGMQTSRYSVEVNYRTEIQEVLDNFAKIVLGYVSAALKNCGYHCKNLFNQKPYRVLISTRNWDDGEWVGVVCFNHSKNHFMLGKGIYNKDRKSIAVEDIAEIDSKSASDIVRKLRNSMEELKKATPRGSQTLHGVPMKRGPKSKFLKRKKKKSF